MLNLFAAFFFGYFYFFGFRAEQSKSAFCCKQWVDHL